MSEWHDGGNSRGSCHDDNKDEHAPTHSDDPTRMSRSHRKRQRYESSSSDSGDDTDVPPKYSKTLTSSNKDEKNHKKKKKKKERKKDSKKKQKRDVDRRKKEAKKSARNRITPQSNTDMDNHQTTQPSITETTVNEPTAGRQSIGRDAIVHTEEGSQQNLGKARSLAPMTRAQYDAQQSIVREVYDEQTGRYRLIRGTGEVIERMVSRSQHLAINQQATRGDGGSFARSVMGAAIRRK